MRRNFRRMVALAGLLALHGTAHAEVGGKLFRGMDRIGQKLDTLSVKLGQVMPLPLAKALVRADVEAKIYKVVPGGDRLAMINARDDNRTQACAGMVCAIPYAGASVSLLGAAYVPAVGKMMVEKKLTLKDVAKQAIKHPGITAKYVGARMALPVSSWFGGAVVNAAVNLGYAAADYVQAAAWDRIIQAGPAVQRR